MSGAPSVTASETSSSACARRSGPDDRRTRRFSPSQGAGQLPHPHVKRHMRSDRTESALQAVWQAGQALRIWDKPRWHPRLSRSLRAGRFSCTPMTRDCRSRTSLSASIIRRTRMNARAPARVPAALSARSDHSRARSDMSSLVHLTKKLEAGNRLRYPAEPWYSEPSEDSAVSGMIWRARTPEPCGGPSGSKPGHNLRSDRLRGFLFHRHRDTAICRQAAWYSAFDFRPPGSA